MPYAGPSFSSANHDTGTTLSSRSSSATGVFLPSRLLVQNHFELKGETLYIGPPGYKSFDGAPIKLQAHGDPSPPISFRNIWVRELK